MEVVILCDIGKGENFTLVKSLVNSGKQVWTIGSHQDYDAKGWEFRPHTFTVLPRTALAFAAHLPLHHSQLFSPHHSMISAKK